MKFNSVQLYDPANFIDNTRRVIDVSVEKGIRAVIAKRAFQVPEAEPSFLSFEFSEAWTEEQQEKFVKENKGRSVKGLLKLYEPIPMNDDASKKVVKFYLAEIKKIDVENKIAYAQITNDSVDRDEEINTLDSWKKRKKSFIQHPVLLSSHKYDSLIHQIGEAVEMNWDTMVFGFKYYAGEGNPEADWAWKLAQKKRAMYSVGYIPHTRLFGDAIPEEFRAKQPRAVYPDNELLEVSHVVVGSNRGALQLSISGKPNMDHVEYASEVMKAFGDQIPNLDSGAIDTDPGKPPKEEKTAAPKEKITPDSTIISPVEIKDMKELSQITEIYRSGELVTKANAKSIDMCVEAIQETCKMMQDLCETLMNLKKLSNRVEEGGEKTGKDVTEQTRKALAR